MHTFEQGKRGKDGSFGSEIAKSDMETRLQSTMATTNFPRDSELAVVVMQKSIT